MNSVFTYLRGVLIVCFIMSQLVFVANSNAQFPAGTLINIGKEGTTVDLGISKEQQTIKNKAGKGIGTIALYDGLLKIHGGSKVEIHETGGLLKNIQHLKGKATFIESFILNGQPISREITYTNATATVTKCSVKGEPNPKFVFTDSSYLDLMEPRSIVLLIIKEK